MFTRGRLARSTKDVAVTTISLLFILGGVGKGIRHLLKAVMVTNKWSRFEFFFKFVYLLYKIVSQSIKTDT